jgi:DNA repair protein RAD7
VFNEGTQATSACVSSLRILQLRNCGHGFTDQVAETVSEKHGRGLEMLELTGCYRLNEAALCLLLQKCRENLKSLDLSCNSRLGVNSASVVASMNCLTYLKLDNATPFTNIMLSPLLDSDALGSLEHLSLAGLIDVDDAGLGPVIKKFGPKLRSLCIGGCVQLTDESIVTIRESCRVLDALDIGRLGQITTAALLGLFIEGPVQQGGVIVEIPILFDTGIEADDVVEPSLPHEMSRSASEGATGSDSMIGRLTTINLSGLPSAVTDDVIIQLCQLSGSLQSVDIGGCASLTSRAISALQLHCRDSLETLDVSFVRNFSEDALGALVDQAPQLKNLSVWGCTQLTKRFFDGHRNDYLNIDGRMEA